MSSVWAPVVDAQGLAIVAEMKLYKKGMDAMWVWLFYGYGFDSDPLFEKEKFSWLKDEYEAFRNATIHKLPMPQHLLGQTEQFYKRSYAEYDSARPYKDSRCEVLKTVSVLLNGMRTLQRKLCALLQGKRSPRDMTKEMWVALDWAGTRQRQSEAYLVATEQAFAQWDKVARAFVVSGVKQLRHREETGNSTEKRKRCRGQRVPALLAELALCV
jgi:hypothetical protein